MHDIYQYYVILYHMSPPKFKILDRILEAASKLNREISGALSIPLVTPLINLSIVYDIISTVPNPNPHMLILG